MRRRQLNSNQQLLFLTTSDMPVTTAKPNENGVFSRKAHSVKEIHYKAKNIEWSIYILRLSEYKFIFSHNFSMDTGSCQGSSSPLSCHAERWSYCLSEQDAFDKAIYRIKYFLNGSKKNFDSKAEGVAARVGLKWLDKKLSDNSLILKEKIL